MVRNYNKKEVFAVGIVKPVAKFILIHIAIYLLYGCIDMGINKYRNRKRDDSKTWVDYKGYIHLSKDDGSVT